jgi:hypothetical protein
MNVSVETAKEKIGDDRAPESPAMSLRSRARLTNLLAVVRRHQRKIQNDASLLQSSSPSNEMTTDIIPGANA